MPPQGLKAHSSQGIAISCALLQGVYSWVSVCYCLLVHSSYFCEHVQIRLQNEVKHWSCATTPVWQMVTRVLTIRPCWQLFRSWILGTSGSGTFLYRWSGAVTIGSTYTSSELCSLSEPHWDAWKSQLCDRQTKTLLLTMARWLRVSFLAVQGEPAKKFCPVSDHPFHGYRTYPWG